MALAHVLDSILNSLFTGIGTGAGVAVGTWLVGRWIFKHFEKEKKSQKEEKR